MIGLPAYVHREWLLFIRSKLDLWLSLAPPLITMVFFAASMAGAVREVNGVPYLLFILPGIAVMSLSSSTLSLSTRTFNEGFSPILRELFSLPVTRPAYVIAKLASGTLLGTFQGLCFLVVGGLVYGLPLTVSGLAQSLLVLLLISSCLSGLYLCVALSFRDMAGFLVTSNVLAQLLLWSSTIFYPVEVMPRAFRFVSYGNPVSYASDLLRDAFLTYPLNETYAWLALVGLTLLFGATASLLLVRRMGRFL